MTLYPHSKCSLDRAIDILEIHGPERLWMNSACDWGVSDPLAVPKCALQMKARQHTPEHIERIIYQNPRDLPQPVAEVCLLSSAARRSSHEED